MDFSSCSMPIQKSCKPKIGNQGIFVSKLFSAMGSNLFSSSKYGDHEYERKLCNGTKPLTSEMKNTLRNSFNLENLSNFLLNNIQDDKIQGVVRAFGFPKSIIPRKDILTQALARQYQLIIMSEEKIVENIVLNEYQRIFDGQAEYNLNGQKPLYQGDSAINYSNLNCLEANIYEVIQVTFDILNAGSVPWINRKLVFIQEKTSCPIPKAERKIDIPTIKPNDRFTTTIEMETRGSEGDFACHFEMLDSDDNNCFPNRKTFDIRIRVTFDPY